MQQDTILILGNLGYIGPVLTAHLRDTQPNRRIIGFDTGFFEGCRVTPYSKRAEWPDVQNFGDVREIDRSLFAGVTAVIYLAAISNDPMGEEFASQTADINCAAALRTAQIAKAAGVSRFVFASSCSVYGAAGSRSRTEADPTNPLTAYAKSKIEAEKKLADLAAPGFVVTCLRFATACGASPRLRLDLVLNDFVACAILFDRIEILSDGSPYRPLIDVEDMSRAIDWSIARTNGDDFLVVNAGLNRNNFSVLAIAEAVQRVHPSATITVNRDAAPDKRSYQVDFSLFETLAGDYMPQKPLEKSIREVSDLLMGYDALVEDFRSSHLVRLNTLRWLVHAERLSQNLSWL